MQHAEAVPLPLQPLPVTAEARAAAVASGLDRVVGKYFACRLPSTMGLVLWFASHCSIAARE